jgi:hypothetical protein
VVVQTDGIVRDEPRWWLRLDGLVLLGGSLALFGTTGEPWWLVPLVILVPDLFMAGYAGGTRVGAVVYNLGHTYPIAALVAGCGLATRSDLITAVGLLWFAHIGMDRAAGYGLKYDDSFGHTHLGWIGRNKGPDAPPG